MRRTKLKPGFYYNVKLDFVYLFYPNGLVEYVGDKGEWGKSACSDFDGLKAVEGKLRIWNDLHSFELLCVI